MTNVRAGCRTAIAKCPRHATDPSPVVARDKRKCGQYSRGRGVCERRATEHRGASVDSCDLQRAILDPGDHAAAPFGDGAGRPDVGRLVDRELIGGLTALTAKGHRDPNGGVALDARHELADRKQRGDCRIPRDGDCRERGNPVVLGRRQQDLGQGRRVGRSEAHDEGTP